MHVLYSTNYFIDGIWHAHGMKQTITTTKIVRLNKKILYTVNYSCQSHDHSLILMVFSTCSEAQNVNFN